MVVVYVIGVLIIDVVFGVVGVSLICCCVYENVTKKNINILSDRFLEKVPMGLTNQFALVIARIGWGNVSEWSCVT